MCITGERTTLFKLQTGRRHLLLVLPAGGDRTSLEPLLQKIPAQLGDHTPELLETLVLLPPSGDEVAGESPAACWQDATGELHQQLGVRHDTLILVRPDGYIAYRSQPADLAAVVTHLNKYLQIRSLPSRPD